MKVLNSIKVMNVKLKIFPITYLSFSLMFKGNATTKHLHNDIKTKKTVESKEKNKERINVMQHDVLDLHKTSFVIKLS